MGVANFYNTHVFVGLADLFITNLGVSGRGLLIPVCPYVGYL